MRLLELRLIEDHRSAVRFPGNLTVVAGASPAARAWLAGAIPALLRGVECGATALVQVDGASREAGPGALAQSFVARDVDPVLGPGPFRDALAALDEPAPDAAPPHVTPDQLARARTTYDSTMQSLDALERSTELNRAEQRGAAAALDDITGRILEARAAIDPVAPVVRDRSLEAAARLEVETGALPGVCRGESEEAAKERIVRLEAALYEFDSALTALVPVDTDAIEQALDIVRVITATGPIEVPEAIRLADDYQALRAQIAALEERVAVDEGGMASVNDRLDHARARVAAAEARVQPVQADADDIVALERAHDAVLEAERRVSGLFGSRSKKVLDDALAEEQAVLDRLGYPTWSAFIMGARMLDSAAENKRQLELARRELDAAERVWSRVMAKLGENPEFTVYLDRLERLQEAAHAIVGDVDDVEAALRALRVDPGRPTMTLEAARDNLASCLLDVGFGIEDHATLADLEAAARAWLDDVREIAWLHTQLDADARHCAFELDEARETLERIQILGRIDEVESFGADRLYAARADIVAAEERLWRHRDAVIRAAQLVAESERIADLDAQLTASLAEKESLLTITRELADASAAKLSLLEATYAGQLASGLGSTPETPAPAGTPDRVEVLSAVLEERITALRDAGVDGSLPLVIDDAFADLAPTERAELLGWLEGYSLFLQVIYLAGGPEPVAWAEGRNSGRTRVVHGEGFFA